MSDNFEIAQKTVEAFKQKNYAQLLSMPSPSLIDNNQLSPEATLEFSRQLLEDQTLSIEIKLRMWELPADQAKRKAASDQFFQSLNIELTAEDEAELAEDLEELLAEGVLSEAQDPLPHPDNQYVFSGSSFTFDFEMKKDGQLILNDWDESQRLEELMEDSAPWMGKTGLPNTLEHQLLRYLRLELGELLVDEDATRAKDLVFLGRYHRYNATFQVYDYYYIWQATNHEKLYGFIIDEHDIQGQRFTSISMGNKIKPILKSGYILEYESL